MKRRGKCVHFRGIQHDTCLDGRDWRAITGGDEFGAANRMPCFAGNAGAKCDYYREPTQEDVDAQEAQWARCVENMALVLPVVDEWRGKPPIGKNDVIACPVCGGRLHLVQSGSNGHVHGRCETDGCVSWME